MVPPRKSRTAERREKPARHGESRYVLWITGLGSLAAVVIAVTSWHYSARSLDAAQRAAERADAAYTLQATPHIRFERSHEVREPHRPPKWFYSVTRIPVINQGPVDAYDVRYAFAWTLDDSVLVARSRYLRGVFEVGQRDTLRIPASAILDAEIGNIDEWSDHKLNESLACYIFIEWSNGAGENFYRRHRYGAIASSTKGYCLLDTPLTGGVIEVGWARFFEEFVIPTHDPRFDFFHGGQTPIRGDPVSEIYGSE